MSDIIFYSVAGSLAVACGLATVDLVYMLIYGITLKLEEKESTCTHDCEQGRYCTCDKK